mgnify:CR=1 FL=1
MNRACGFTLVELLVVVAIISLLVTMAVPNYLDAQTRAKATVVAADQKVLGDAILMYCLDNGTWPPHLDGDRSQHRFMTSPIAYISEPVRDKFQEGTLARWRNGYEESVGMLHAEPHAIQHEKYKRTEPEFYNRTKNAAFFIWSFGPDQRHDDGTDVVRFDITNGVGSAGDIIRPVDGMYMKMYPYTCSTYEEQNRMQEQNDIVQEMMDIIREGQ